MAQRITMKHMNGLTLDVRHAQFLVEYIKDMDAQRAAKAVGYSPAHGGNLIEREDIQEALNHVIKERLKESQIDAEWVMMEAVDNHYLARQQSNISASTQALNLIAKMSLVDAFAAEKVMIASDKEIMERLQRARKRNKNNDDNDSIDSMPNFL